MRILLCTPFEKDAKIPSGGIAVWARNIMAYYKQRHEESISVEVMPFDRSTEVEEGMNILKRVIEGIAAYWGAYMRTKKRIIEEHFDIAHFTTSAQLGLFRDWLLLRMAGRKGVKTILHLHFGRVPELAKQNNWEWKMLRRVSRSADMVVAIDQKSFETLQQSGIINSSYLPNPLTDSIIKEIVEEANQIKRLSNKLLFVGHVIETKGVFELIESCRQIRGIELHIIGSCLPDIRAKINAIAGGNANWLKMRGTMNHDEVIREMLSAGVFVLPTYTEGFPNVILEAMACGCPIVTTDVGAIPEMLDIDNGMNYGICVKPKDVDGLRLAIQKMLSDRDYARTCGAKAQLRVNEMYAMPIVWKRLVEIWEKCC